MKAVGSLLLLAGVLPLLFGLVILVHELGHAVAARLMGLRVLSIEVGAGPAVWTRWTGGVLWVLRSTPLQGLVRCATSRPGLLRLRTAFLLGAGPLVNGASAALAWAWWMSLPPWTSHAPSLLIVVSAFWISSWVAVWNLLPMQVRIGGVMHPTDGKQLLGLIGAKSNSGAVIAFHREALAQHVFLRRFLHGDVEGAIESLRTAGVPEDRRWLLGIPQSIAVMARDGPAAALAVHSEVEAINERQAATGGAGADELRAVLAINRAFFLAHLGGDAALREADELSARAVQQLGGVAAIRTRGLVLVHRGEVEYGLTLLERAWRMEEPHWLRSLCAAYLAHAHALRGDARRARAFLRRAHRLAPGNPLLPQRAGIVERVLATAG